MQSRPHTGFGPLGQTPPAGHPRPEAQFLREVFPRDPCVEHQQDALEHQPVRMPLPPRMMNPTLHPRQKRLDHHPEFIVHFPRLPPSHPAPLDQRPQGHPTSPMTRTPRRFMLIPTAKDPRSSRQPLSRRGVHDLQTHQNRWSLLMASPGPAVTMKIE